MRLIGIDEAGLGPVVGPLVVTAVALELPDALADADLWSCLAGAVGRRPAEGRPLAIADSKALYRGGRGPNRLRPLERGVLAALGCLAPPPAGLQRLLETVSAAAPGPEIEPWLDGADLELPRTIPPDELAATTDALRGCLASAGIRITSVRSEIVHAARLNRLLAEHDNKAEAAFAVFASVLAPFLRDPSPALVHADRLGARRRYREHLQRLPDVEWVRTLDESPARSTYRIEARGAPVEIRFEVGCDAGQLPVALASMISKYLRELHMEQFNRFWCEHVPGLLPTAGYVTDGTRFLADIEPTRRRLGIPLELIRRDR